MQFLIGAAGAFLFIGILVTGVVVGWKAHARYAVQKTTEQATKEELQKIKEHDDAFHAVTGYSVEQAYGLVLNESTDKG